jgi:GNAT superfamily N-acetyltransferase
MSVSTTSVTSGRASRYAAAPASGYTFEQLADIYNGSRVDYIVPMPMNARRMEDYVRAYDVDLDASVVVVDDDEPAGVGMLGLRDSRAWITRVGVIPERRRHRQGQFIMESLIAQAAARGVAQVQLEVIRGNEPARHLFVKLGFEETRELLVVRRPPVVPRVTVPSAAARPLSADEMLALLKARDSGASWLDETASLRNLGTLEGLEVRLENGACGWIAFQRTSFQLSHLVLKATHDTLALALLYHLHAQYPSLDTKLENLPSDSVYLPAFQALGYHEVFARVEMVLMRV